MESKSSKPVKMTITYEDGTITDYPVFIAAVASGLMVGGREGDTIFYAPGSEGFSSQGIAHVAATSEVVYGLIIAVKKIINSILEQSPVECLLELMSSASTMGIKTTEEYNDVKFIKKRPSEN